MNSLEKFQSVDIAEGRLNEASESLVAISDQISKDAKEIIIAGGDDREIATYVLKDIKTIVSGLEKTRNALVSPLNARVKEVNDFFKRHTVEFQGSDKILRGKVIDYEWKQEGERLELEAAARRAEEEARRKVDEAARIAAESANKESEEFEAAMREAEQAKQEAGTKAVAAMAPEKTQRYDGVKSTTKKVWTFEILDNNAVPRKYLEVDTTAIRNAVRAGVRDIPGVRIYQDVQLSIS